MSFDATFSESSTDGPTHTSEAAIPINGSEKVDESGGQSASLTSQSVPPAQLAFILILQTRQVKALRKKKRRKRRRRREEKEEQEKKSKNTAAPDNKKVNEEENRSKQFEVKEVDPNIVVDLKASTKSAEADKQGTHVDIDQPTSFTRSLRKSFRHPRLAIILKFLKMQLQAEKKVKRTM